MTEENTADGSIKEDALTTVEAISPMDDMIHSLDQLHNLPLMDDYTSQVIEHLRVDQDGLFRQSILAFFGERRIDKNRTRVYMVVKFGKARNYKLEIRDVVHFPSKGTTRWASKPIMSIDLEELEFCIANKIIQRGLPFLNAERQLELKRAAAIREDQE